MTATKKIVNGEEVALSSEESAAIEAEWADNELARRQRPDLIDCRALQAAYAKRLGLANDPTLVLADALGVLIEKVRAMESGEAAPAFDALVAEIDGIKAVKSEPV